jgi:hypothetical protein
VRRITTTSRRRWILGIAAAALAALPATASAQVIDVGAPSPGTPTSNQYEIPVQAGRHDAAPPRAQRNSGGGSLYRSENNFGSSSVVPGDPGGGSGPSGGAASGSGSGGGGRSVAAGGAVGGAAAGVGAVVAGAGETLDTGSPSTSAAYTTLPLIILLGIVIGIAGVKMRRRAEL